ncbi:MAG: hypothetical protein JNJ75_16755 [Cyclobacteriaceae bacterium]|nr:hypothetical protein [Cyclobacteriaceae bacterium]
MSLYREIPKESIVTLLRQRFSTEELDAVRLEVQDLLLTCHSMAELQVKIFDALKSKRGSGIRSASQFLSN